MRSATAAASPISLSESTPWGQLHVQRWPIGAATSQMLLAELCWLALGLVVYAADPDSALARAAFFCFLFGALAFTLTPILHALMLRCSHSRIFQQQSGVIAARESLMCAAFVVLNALLQMLRAWTGLVALLLLGMFAVIEIAALARR